ncbi:hypothetical protein PAXRUDRAFT_18678 [Paxillus rubicundulus Ve08.2h10]|uniref:Unplaced genomic scaffold scaffold_3036, whole genome shotgun sequence n=1 Tax=Paxillus rubicundulus Ve08.2h10 TaxID=930991 RepID=A0A0D0CXC7_9AGAM|nr:hypothetical protein PAXRUDRAFT_18678 [Paxillus rubicundulus Ve08.2h10]
MGIMHLQINARGAASLAIGLQQFILDGQLMLTLSFGQDGQAAMVHQEIMFYYVEIA